MTQLKKDFNLEKEDAADLLKEIAESLETDDQLNIDFGEEKLIQPIKDEIPLRVYQDDEGTEIGFRL